MLFAVLAGVALLAFANGANDNFKGVATLYGSGVTGYRSALAWATLTTILGCLLAVWIADGLASRFSGKELLPDSLLDARVASVIALSTAGVVLLATLLGMPVSTTHALLGALVGSAIFLKGWDLPWTVIALKFLMPLALSPTLALLVAWVAVRFAPASPACVCVEPTVASLPHPTAAAELTLDAESACEARGATKLVSGRSIMTGLHYLSSGSVSLARGMNDAPKLAGILLATSFIDWSGWMLACLGLTMALGGILGSARVARTMSREITTMTDTQGFVANLVTSTLVLGASFISVPVSTTHVSCGALGGLGLQTRAISRKRFGHILLAWFVTLPAGALVAAALLLVL